MTVRGGASLAFAWRSLVRQPARASLGVLGVAAVGALLFDMLLLSQGLIVSMGDLLERTGWDVRVTATEDLPGSGPRIPDAAQALRTVSALPSVRAALAIRFADGRIEGPSGESVRAFLQGASEGPAVPWTVLRGRDISGEREIVVNDAVASSLSIGPGGFVMVRASCGATGESDALVRRTREAIPPVRFQVAGIAEFPFQETGEGTAASTLDALAEACGGNAEDEASVLLVTSSDDPAAAAAAIRRALPHLTAVTNDEMIGRLQRAGFTYFQQISAVLTTVTLSFAVLLITVLLTVSVNQRLGEIATLRALGFSRRRVAADVLSESALIVGSGALLSLPLGLALAAGLDRILKRMPGIPEALHFFVFEPSALVVHLTLLAATAIVAALYPIRIVSQLPISATLRDEVVG